MELKQIRDIAEAWRLAIEKVIEFENPGFEEVQRLFSETCDIVEEYAKETLVPKEISGLLLEIHDFGWWVSDLDETPLHALYQEIVSLVCDLNRYFLTGDADMRDIKTAIEKIVE